MTISLLLQNTDTHYNMTSTFQDFCKEWKDEESHHLHQLRSAANTLKQPQTESSLSSLVHLVISKYQEHYRTKSKWAKKHIFLMFSPPLKTPLELAFLWAGGWRPTTAFHVLYSKCGLQIEATLFNLAETGGFSHLSSDQLVRIDQLQRVTIQQEREIDGEVAEQQERAADMEMVELSHDASNVIPVPLGQINAALKKKEEGFRRILQTADDLRLRTLAGVVDILSPIQGVHFLIAAAELKLKLHQWGKEKEMVEQD